MARFVIVLPLVPLAAGDEFTVADWPLHVTLVEPFATELTAEAIAHVLGSVASDTTLVQAAAGNEAMFGRRRDVPVTLVRDDGELEALRMRALEAIRTAGVHIDVDPSREEFRPHVTRKRHGRLRPGDRVVLETLALIDMRPPEGSHHRRVMAAWRLGEASDQQVETGAKPPPPYARAMDFSVPQQRRLVTELPGPRSRELLERRRRAVSSGAGTLADIFMDHGSGAILVDVDGNQLIDLGCGIGVTTIGHAHPDVAAAASAQAAKLTHTLFTVTPYENYVRVAEKLAEITPGDFEKRSILVNSGAEAVENAVKIARKFTGRRGIASLDHAFHGRTNLTMAMTYRPWPERAGMGPFPGELYSVPSSYPFKDGLSGADAAARTIDYIVTHIGASELAALFVEPIQGDGGVVIPAEGYFEALSAFCTEHGILFVADEIQAGIARTGAWYSIEHFNVVPDLVTTAKGIAGGFPLAAVTGRAEIMDAVQPGGIGGTFGGNPVSTAAALATFEVIERDGLIAEAQRVERAFAARIGDWASRFSVVAEVRGKGAMWGAELVEPGTRTPSPRALKSVIAHAAANGVIVLDAGSWDSVLRFLPSVVISEELIDDAASVIEEELARLSA